MELLTKLQIRQVGAWWLGWLVLYIILEGGRQLAKESLLSSSHSRHQHPTLTPDHTPALQPAGGSARTNEQAFAKAHSLGYPVMIRWGVMEGRGPHYQCGGVDELSGLMPFPLISTPM